ncbi:ACT domain-containing protein [Kiritimatiella glycovorans]|uniref:ACT domain-containing protein n=1 Tax=Kiritimatiella glycovorans TaxID=1307763 RepID=A0A0G3EHW3_9BACT|nr:ACT domain-containing protein [Kiritimatiella glycovorans]AKJ63774.1 ACT domain-containing protein [Kiritimatiella glycovorans]
MNLKQLSVFIENRPGGVSQPCRTLADEGINIITLSLADTEQFGILRLVVREWEKARDALETAGFVVKVTEVLATEVSDRPGGLAEILDALEEKGVNVEYMYAFTLKRGGQAVLIFRFDDMDRALEILRERGFNVLDGVELYRRAET